MVSPLSSAVWAVAIRVAPALSGPVEKGVTHLTGGLLRPNSHLCGLGRHVAGAGKQGDSGELRAVGQALRTAAEGYELGHESGVPAGLLPPKLVVKVGGGQGEVQLRPKMIQGVEQADGVGPAGDRAQHMAAGGDQAPGGQ